MIPLCEPNLTGNEAGYVLKAMEDNYIGPGGPFVERFEAAVAQASGRKWAIATITGTAAIHAAAVVLDFYNERVDVPKHAFPAARRVFEEMGCSITTVPGGMRHDAQNYKCDDQPNILCDRAPAIGEPPTSATVECYSFAANKPVTCGHGGAIVGDSSGLETRLRSLINQGYGRDGKFNYRMADINAAVGCAQMRRLEELRDAKRRIWYRYAAQGIPMIYRGLSRWMATADGKPSGLEVGLRQAGIGFRLEEFDGISLPCGTGLTVKDQDKVIEICAKYWR